MDEPDQQGSAQVGVGPWPGEWPAGDQWDPELLRSGDRRNVVDAYRYWRHEAIVADLDTRRHDFHVAVENWGHDFNIGSVIRTANAMNAKAFHIVGRRRWNRRGAMVTDRYQHEQHHVDAAALARWAEGEGLVLVGVDNLPGSVPLETFDLPRRCVLVFGQEGPGLTERMRAECEVVLHIEQFGSTRSINAGAAAAIAMHAWVRRHVFGQSPLTRSALPSRMDARAGTGAVPSEERPGMGHTYGISEVVGTSKTSIDEAIAGAVSRANRTVRHLDWFEVVNIRGHVVDGAVAHYQVTIKLGFRVDDD